MPRYARQARVPPLRARYSKPGESLEVSCPDDAIGLFTSSWAPHKIDRSLICEFVVERERGTTGGFDEALASQQYSGSKTTDMRMHTQWLIVLAGRGIELGKRDGRATVLTLAGEPAGRAGAGL